MTRRLALLALLTAACGGTSSSHAPEAASADEATVERVVTEKQPDGSIKRTTIRTTRRTVPAKPPPVRPAWTPGCYQIALILGTLPFTWGGERDAGGLFETWSGA